MNWYEYLCLLGLSVPSKGALLVWVAETPPSKDGSKPPNKDRQANQQSSFKDKKGEQLDWGHTFKAKALTSV
jgi:hypothetical protein